MKRALKYGLFVGLFTVIFAMLHDRITLSTVIMGVIISTFALIFSDRYLLDIPYIDIFGFNPFRLITYFIYLLWKILAAGFVTMITVISGNAHFQRFTYESQMTDDFSLNLLANSITLTPGTVTVTREGSTLVIMQLCYKACKVTTEGIDEFEHRIMRIGKEA